MPEAESERPVLLTRRQFSALLPLGLVACQIPEESVPTTSFGLADIDARSVGRDSSRYEAWRTGMPWQSWTADRYPAVIVRPNNRQAAIETVRFAGQNNYRIAIKSGGHNLSEAFLRDASLLLDLGELQGIEVNPSDKTAWVEPALWSHHLIQHTATHGLAFPVAHCATVPMGGYILGGGLGSNGDEWNTIACHSILAAEIVLADGRLITASPTENAEIYWAVRGAGTGFFGVVLRYKLQLYDLPSQIYESRYMFPIEHIDAADSLLSDLADAGIRKTELMMLIAHNPLATPDSGAPPHVCVARIIAFADSKKEAEDILARAAGHPATRHAAFSQTQIPTSFEELGKGSVDWSQGLGFGRSLVDTVWTDEPAELLPDLVKPFGESTSSHNHVIVSYKINPKLRDDASFSVIGKAFVGAYAVWEKPTDDADNFSWIESMGQALRARAKGSYINEVNAFRNPDVQRACFDDASWHRLSRLREKYDPDQIFHGFVT